MEKRKVILTVIFLVMLSAVAGVVGYYIYEGTHYVETEDARVAGDIVRITPKVVGELMEFNVEEGQNVEKNEILGKQDINNITDSTALEKAFIKAPISGKVIKKQGTIGETVAPGQILVMIVDSKKLYITANIEETKLNSVKVGQTVDIKIDQFGKKEFKGTVKAIGQASASTFSIFPSSSGTTFTKVVQKIPVRIEFEHGEEILMGTNAVVKIHIK